MTRHTTQQLDAKANVIIIGGGPIGSYTALHLSKAGVKATVFEEHPEIGVPSHCAGHLSIRSLKGIGLYPLPAGILENTFRTASFYSPKGTEFSIHLNRPVTAAVDRARFDRFLAERAKEAGASFILGTRVQSLLLSGGLVKGVNIETESGSREEVSSKLVIDAEGISSRLVRQAGLRPLKPQSLVYAIETEIENVRDIDPDGVEVFLGSSYASGFYGWVIPRLDGSAKVGLATSKGNPRDCLNALIAKHPVASKQLGKSQIKHVSYHSITLGGPIEKTYAPGFLAVGDCASQVKPTTGGGVIFGCTCAKIAAETASIAVSRGDVSNSALQVYHERWSDLLGFDFKVMLHLRRFFNSLSDEKVDEMLRVCGKLGVDKALSNEDEIDFQGKMILKAIGKPSMLAALAYFGLLYLSANP